MTRADTKLQNVLHATCLVLLAWVTLLVSACQSLPERDLGTDGVASRIQEELAAAAAPATAAEPVQLPRDVSEALLPPIGGAAGSVSGAQPRFDFSANAVPAREAFLSLVEGTPYSMAVHPEVEGTITLDLKNVTLFEALDTLRDVHGYAYRREGQRIMILGRGMQTRIYPVNYLNFTRRGSSQLRVTSGELTQAAGDAGGQSAGSAGGISVSTESEANFWLELGQALEAIVGSDDGRKVVINPQSNLVVVRANAFEQELVERFLGLTQDAVNRQVVLEAKILEVELTDGFQSGINWADLSDVGGFNTLISQTGGGTVFSGTGVSNIAGNQGNLTPDANFDPVNTTQVSAFGGLFSLTLKKNDDFAAFMELLQTQGDVHVLSSPRVSTVNNQKAVIKVGGDEFFVTGITNNTTTSGDNVTQSPEVELTPFFSGIALDVTPQIDDAGNVILHIHPSVSEVLQRSKSIILGDQDLVLPLAVSRIQESDNVVRAGSGQIVVIGGLMKEAANESEASVPLLGDLPVVGQLFKQKKVTRIKKELVILLKPTVVESDRQWGNFMGESLGRVVNMRRSGSP